MIFILLYIFGYFACMYIFVPHAFMVPIKVKKRPSDPLGLKSPCKC